jgi:hypothetical protein
LTAFFLISLGGALGLLSTTQLRLTPTGFANGPRSAQKTASFYGSFGLTTEALATLLNEWRARAASGDS